MLVQILFTGPPNRSSGTSSIPPKNKILMEVKLSSLENRKDYSQDEQHSASLELDLVRACLASVLASKTA